MPPSKPPTRKRRLGPLVTGLWIVNLICVVIAGVALFVYWDRTPFALAASAPIIPLPTLDPSPIQIASPTLRPRPASSPSPTPEPTLTPYVQPSNTPFVLANDLGINIGYSVAGRSLEVYAFGDGPSGRMIVAGIHGGNEWNTIDLAYQLITYVDVHPEIIPDNVTLYILPDLNPDGEARGHGPIGRTNDHGVDLNRNFPSNWKSQWDKDGCWILLPVTAGENAASEPETNALMIFMKNHRMDALISYHSAALGIFPGGNPPDEGAVSLAKALAAVSDYSYPPLDTGCEYTGALADWATDQGIAAVDLELTNHTDTDFNQNLKVLTAFLKWNP